MSEELKYERVVHPDGRVFNVSTVRTLAGGGGNNPPPMGVGFDEAAYLDETPWPYETMVFKDIGGAGQYHAPSASKAAALREHVRVVQLIKAGGEFEGIGVQGLWGNPTMTTKQWLEMHPRAYDQVRGLTKE